MKNHPCAMQWAIFMGMALLAGGLATPAQGALLFHATFDNTLKATTPKREIEPDPGAGELVKGVLNGGVLVNRHPGLKYPSEGAINKDRGSIAFWVCPQWNGGEGNHGLFHAEGSGGSELYIYAMDDGRLVFNVRGPGGIQHYDNIPIKSGARKFRAEEWHHLVCSWKTSPNPQDLFYEIYVDGVRVTNHMAVPKMLEESCEIGELKPFFSIGAYQKDAADAVFDDFRIYDEPLLPEEVKKLFEMGDKAQ